MTQDEFDMFLTAAVRTALKQSGSGVEDYLLVAGFQRQGKKQGVLKRLTAKDLPQMRISVANDQAKSEMSAREILVFIGTCSVTTTLVSAFTKSDNRAKVKFSFDLLEPHIGSLLLAFLCLT